MTTDVPRYQYNLNQLRTVSVN